MTYADQKSCLTCAWRETCQKRFSSTEDLGLRCPDYTFDLRLKKRTSSDEKQTPDPDIKKGAGNA
ncbi:MAG: hypothetical protein ACP5JP_01700 [bacterium]